MIRATGLTKKYGSLTAVDNLNLSVKSGDIFGFLGPNGAGKTTTIKMLIGLLTPTAGSAEICGIDVAKNPVEAKSKVDLYLILPIPTRGLRRGSLRFVADLRRLPAAKAEAKIDELMALFELTDRQYELLGGYSHGMRQKVCIASALIGEPDVLFLDEPTVGLDPKSARLVKDILRRVADDGGAVFVSTHVLEIAERMCDRVGIIQRGRLIAEGTVEELRAKAVPGKAGEDASLEDLFLKLTGGEEHKDLIKHLSSDESSR